MSKPVLQMASTSDKSLIVVSPPGGVGEVAAVKAENAELEKKIKAELKAIASAVGKVLGELPAKGSP